MKSIVKKNTPNTAGGLSTPHPSPTNPVSVQNSAVPFANGGIKNTDLSGGQQPPPMQSVAASRPSSHPQPSLPREPGIRKPLSAPLIEKETVNPSASSSTFAHQTSGVTPHIGMGGAVGLAGVGNSIGFGVTAFGTGGAGGAASSRLTSSSATSALPSVVSNTQHLVSSSTDTRPGVTFASKFPVKPSAVAASSSAVLASPFPLPANQPRSNGMEKNRGLQMNPNTSSVRPFEAKPAHQFISSFAKKSTSGSAISLPSSIVGAVDSVMPLPSASYVGSRGNPIQLGSGNSPLPSSKGASLGGSFVNGGAVSRIGNQTLSGGLASKSGPVHVSAAANVIPANQSANPLLTKPTPNMQQTLTSTSVQRPVKSYPRYPIVNNNTVK